MSILTDVDRKVYREELRDRLPKKIFDAHVHIFRKEDFKPDYVFPPRNCHVKFGGDFTMETWKQAMAEILPDQEVSCNCFGTPNLAVDRYFAPEADNRRVFAMALLSPADPVFELKKRVVEQNLIGFKPYLNFAADFFKKKSNDVEIFDMLLPEQMEYANAAGLAVTLHIPRSGRFADPVNQRQMVEICQRYPNAKIIFAHIGRAYFMKNIIDSNIDELAKCPNAYLDTAMVNHPGVIRYACDHFPNDRILFATDTDIALLHGKSVEVNNQYVYLMGEDYRVGSAMYDVDHTVDFTLFFYEQLRAILEAVPKASLDDILFQNSEKLFTTLAKEKRP